MHKNMTATCRQNGGTVITVILIKSEENKSSNILPDADSCV